MGQGFSVEKDQPVRPDEIESLRAAVGWDRMEGRYGKILPKLYAHYSVRENSSDLVGFLTAAFLLTEQPQILVVLESSPNDLQSNAGERSL